MKSLSVLDSVFTAHPRAVGESYTAHAVTAARFGAAMVIGGLGCLAHAVVPALFTTTGSETVRRLHARMGARVPHASQPPVAAAFCYEI